MATEVNQNYFAWSQEESSAQDIPQGTPQLFSHGSISFGRFDLESLEWEKWSVFTNDRRHEEFGKFNGLVAKKKAYFEEYFKRIRELKALQQQNQQTELNLDYSGDGSDSSQTGEDEPSADNGASTGSEIIVNDSEGQKILTTTEVECHDDHENGRLVNESSASPHSSSVGLQQIGKQARQNAGDNTDGIMQNTYLSGDDLGMANKTTLTSKRTVAKEPLIGQASKIIPKTVKMASNDLPARTIAPKDSCSGKPGMMNQMAKPERRPNGATGHMVGTTAGSGINRLRRPSSAASQRPSTRDRERRPITRDASRKPAEVMTPCRPSSTERHSGTRDSALKNANNTAPRRPAALDGRPITKGSAPNQSKIVPPGRPSTADRRAITKGSAPKLSNIATPHRPSTADRRPAIKNSAPKQFNIGSPHRPSTGERHPTARNMAMKHVGTATSCRPSADKQCPVSREGGARVLADVVTLQRPSTADRRPVIRDVAAKQAIVPPPLRPSTAERRPITRDVAPKPVPSCRPSTAERRPVARDSALKHENVASSRWPMIPDRYPAKKSEISTPQRPSTGERRRITNESTLKSDQKTPIRRAVPNYSKGAMSAAVTPRKALTPNLVKSYNPENISRAKEKVEVHMEGRPKSSYSNLTRRKMWTSNIRNDRVLDSFRKPNKEERVQSQAFASNSTTPLQAGSAKMRAPIPPPPPPPPLRPSSIERKPIANNLPASGRKPKASTPRWH